MRYRAIIPVVCGISVDKPYVSEWGSLDEAREFIRKAGSSSLRSFWMILSGIEPHFNPAQIHQCGYGV